MNIRPYEEKDRNRVEEICIETDRNHLERELLLTLYCRYYITHEDENCFVAVDDGDNAIGYIISSSDYYCWKKTFIDDMKKNSPLFIQEKGIESTKGYEKYAKEYPAHLHIDISSKAQRMGIGHQLMDTLVAHYKGKGIRGLMLGVDPENEKGVNFYKKYGFTSLDKDGVFWGIKF